MLALAALGCDGDDAAGAAEGQVCDRGPDCAPGLRCRDGLCAAAASEDLGDGDGDGDGEQCPSIPRRGVGAPCSTAQECDGGLCLKHLSHLQFPRGFCSADVPEAGACCPDGSLGVRIPGLDLRPCLTRCVTDSDCRADDGYFCFLTFGVCFPPPHDDCIEEGGGGVEHCHQAREGEEDGPFFCGDAHDNDADGLIDCDSPVCTFFSNCTGRDNERGAGFCDDRRDNDGDGKTDCEDADCSSFSICSPNADG